MHQLKRNEVSRAPVAPTVILATWEARIKVQDQPRGRGRIVPVLETPSPK
jgi:hypothetical protein